MKKIIGFNLIFICLVGCDPVDMRLKLVNNSNRVVYVELLEDPIDYKEWLEEKRRLYSGTSQEFEIQDASHAPKDTVILSTIGNWEGILKDPESAVYIYVIDTTDLSNYFESKGSLPDRKWPCVLRRSLADIKRENWIILFEGSTCE